jgi:hypothetical protein
MEEVFIEQRGGVLGVLIQPGGGCSHFILFSWAGERKGFEKGT